MKSDNLPQVIVLESASFVVEAPDLENEKKSVVVELEIRNLPFLARFSTLAA